MEAVGYLFGLVGVPLAGLFLLILGLRRRSAARTLPPSAPAAEYPPSIGSQPPPPGYPSQYLPPGYTGAPGPPGSAPNYGYPPATPPPTRPKHSGTALIVVGALLLAVGGLGVLVKVASFGGTSSSSSSSAASLPADYTGLLIKAADIPGPLMWTGKPPVNNPHGYSGVEQIFRADGSTAAINDLILVYPDASAAQADFDNTKREAFKSVSGTPQPAEVGTGGTMVSGTFSSNPSKAVTVLVFTEGRAAVAFTIVSDADQPAVPDQVIEFGRKQDAAVKDGLPS